MRRALAPVLALALLAGAAQAQETWLERAWPATDFSRLGIDLVEVRSGGPGKDGIPAITAPAFLAAADETRLDPREPVMTYLPDRGPARAYPIRYLTWHEIVNDEVNGRPIAVTFCPLCNTGMVFDARVNGVALEFGVSGLLRMSDMIMYDRQTESWWQQALGEAIVGAYLGERLTQLPAWMESWEAFRAAHPDGLVMDEPDAARAYGLNPYAGYDTSARPFLYAGEDPPHGIAPLARVLRVGNRAWPLERIAREGRIEEAGLVITWQAGQASALDTAEIGAGREVGNLRVRDGAGADVIHDMPFAFAFHAFHPDGEWMLGE
ncbi:MAG: hypothetical protein AUK37_03975 [Rhodobacterales bacterium CG2_30_65_12]|nr:MAG: hypothetical protein AUK37_03975 [Rhodobacterales bacterium CG2_30_65_12]